MLALISASVLDLTLPSTFSPGTEGKVVKGGKRIKLLNVITISPLGLIAGYISECAPVLRDAILLRPPGSIRGEEDATQCTTPSRELNKLFTDPSHLAPYKLRP